MLVNNEPQFFYYFDYIAWIPEMTEKDIAALAWMKSVWGLVSIILNS